MREVLFASTNKAKLAQFQYVADKYRFNIEIISVYQKLSDVKPYSEKFKSQSEIIEHGAVSIYQSCGQAVVVEDTILEVDSLAGRPGITSNDYLRSAGRAGLVEELQGLRDRSAQTTSVVGYFDGDVLATFTHRVLGSIGYGDKFAPGEPSWVGPTHTEFGGGFNAVFVLDATGKTLAEHSAFEGLTLGYREPNFRAVLAYISSKAHDGFPSVPCDSGVELAEHIADRFDHCRDGG